MKKPIILISTEGKTLEEVQAEAKAAFLKFKQSEKKQAPKKTSPRYPLAQKLKNADTSQTSRIDKLWAELQADPRFNTDPPGPDDPTAIMF